MKNMPGFNAEASLYGKSSLNHGGRSSGPLAGKGAVIPQVPMDVPFGCEPVSDSYCACGIHDSQTLTSHIVILRC